MRPFACWRPAACTRWRRPRGGGWTYGLAGAGAAAMLGALVSLHPYQHLYFNFLVDRATPARLLVRYDLDYWQIAYRDALAFLFAQYPDDPIRVQKQFWHRYHKEWLLLSAAYRQRLAPVNHVGDFYLSDYHAPWLGNPVRLRPPPYTPIIHSEKVYGNTIVDGVAVNLAWVDARLAAPYRAAYRALTARAPVVRDTFDVYLDARAVSWAQAPYRLEDTAPRFLLHLTPVDPQDLPRRSGARASTTSTSTSTNAACAWTSPVWPSCRGLPPPPQPDGWPVRPGRRTRALAGRLHPPSRPRDDARVAPPTGRWRRSRRRTAPRSTSTSPR